MTNRGESGTEQKGHWEITYSDNTSFFGEGSCAFSKAVEEVGVSAHVATRSFDVRQMLPFPDGSCDACYSHGKAASPGNSLR